MFSIIKYIKPTWYFNLIPAKDFGYFPNKKIVDFLHCNLISDSDFSGEAAEQELAYRAHMLGCIDRNYNKGVEWWRNANISLDDEYRFARKYFHPSRVLLALFLRLITFHNPWFEIKSFFRSVGTKKVTLNFGEKMTGKSFEQFPFTIFNAKPMITVVIPTLNRYQLLKNVLHDFEKQDYKNFEVVVVDQSDLFQRDFYSVFDLTINVIRQEEKALWKARNSAIKNATGEFIAFSEDDVRIPADWLTNHLKCIEFFNADISNGVFFPAGGSIPANRSFYKWADQFATGNSFVKKSIFQKTGLFDLQFEKQRMGDGEFGLRAYKAGLKAISNPMAWCEDLKAKTGGLREMGNWDAFRPKSIWSPRPLPSVLYFYRRYFGSQAALFSVLINVPGSMVPYQFKRNKILLVIGSIGSVVLLPILLVQVLRSWCIASRMLKNPMIEEIDFAKVES